MATQPEDRSKLWQARHDAYSCLVLRPGAKVMATDVCVPISRLAECVSETKADLAASGLFGPIVGHVGDGNFHVAVLFDGDDPTRCARMKAFCRTAGRARHRHGRHLHRRARHRPGQDGLSRGRAGRRLDVMRRIKRALDPNDIMNPGKIFVFEHIGRVARSVRHFL